MTDPIGTAQERELIEDIAKAIALDEWDGPLIGWPDDFSETEQDGYRSRARAALKVPALQSRIAEVGRLEERVAELWEAIFRVKDRCWEADDANWQHDILSIVVPLTDAKIDEVRAALSLQRRV